MMTKPFRFMLSAFCFWAASAALAAPTRFDSIVIGTNTFSADSGGGLLLNNAALGSGGGGGGAAMPTQTVSVLTAGGTTGLVFSGSFAPLPNAPAAPNPDNAATAVAQPVTLSWTDTGIGYGVASSFDVLTNGTLAASAQTATSLLLPAMGSSASVSWQVIAHNNSGATTGSVWSFTTAGGSSGGWSDAALAGTSINMDVWGEGSKTYSYIGIVDYGSVSLYTYSWVYDTETGASIFIGWDVSTPANCWLGIGNPAAPAGMAPVTCYWGMDISTLLLVTVPDASPIVSISWNVAPSTW